MSKRRVVITGIGVISPLGNDSPTTWQNILAGKSGIGAITAFDTTEFATKFAGEVKDFDVTQYIAKKETKKMDRFIQFGMGVKFPGFPTLEGDGCNQSLAKLRIFWCHLGRKDLLMLAVLTMTTGPL